MNKKDYEEFMRHCQVVKKLSEDRTLLKAGQTQQLIVAKKLENISSDLISVLSQEKQIMHENLESIIDYYQISADSVMVFTEYSTHTLGEQLVARRKSNSKFSAQDLQNILVSVLKALNYLQQKSIGHGCISPQDILISSIGSVKLIDPSLASNSPFYLISGYFYSPQLLSFNLRTNKNKINENSSSLSTEEQIDFFKNDVFVLGLLIVELGLLNCSINDCFKYDQGYFDYNQLDKLLNQFQCLYPNQSLINLLCGMLQQDPNTRLTTQGALDFIEQEFYNEEEIDSDGLEESNGSSYLTESKDKTVRSFLLSQGPISSIGNYLTESQQSNLCKENNRRYNQLPVRTANIKNGRHSLIRF